VAAYSGDINYAPVTGACGAPDETSVVSQGTGSVAVVKQAPGSAQQVVFTFLIACPGVPNSPFARTVTGSGTTATVDGLPAGTVCTASEVHVAGFQDQPDQAIPAVVGGQTQTVTFVNQRTIPASTGVLVVCKAATPGLSGLFSFRVAGQTVSVAAGQCSAPITVPKGIVTVRELSRPGYALTACAASPARLVSCDVTTGKAKVHVVPGGFARRTTVTFTNQKT
jgi:hypothetical protein